MRLPRTALPFAGLIAGLVAAGCGRSESTRPVDVGHVHPASADDAAFKALDLATEDIKQNPDRGPLGRPIRVIHAPGGSTPDEWGGQAARLIALNKVQALIGGDRAELAERIGMAVQAEDVVAVSPAGWSGAPTSPNLFCVGLAPEERGRVLALVAKAAAKADSGVLIVRDPAAKSANLAADRFAADCRSFGPVTEIEIAAPKKPPAAIVFFAGPARSALGQRDSFPNALLLFGGEEAELPALLSGGPRAEGLQVATAHDPASRPERLAEFGRRYEEKYGQAPSAAAVLTYDALTVWVEAVRRATKLEARPIREEMLKRDKPFDVLTGSLTFADDHTARRPVFVGRVSGGKLADVKSFEAGPAK